MLLIFVNIQHSYFDTAEILQIDMAHTGYKHKGSVAHDQVS